MFASLRGVQYNWSLRFIRLSEILGILGTLHLVNVSGRKVMQHVLTFQTALRYSRWKEARVYGLNSWMVSGVKVIRTTDYPVTFFTSKLRKFFSISLFLCQRKPLEMICKYTDSSLKSPPPLQHRLFPRMFALELLMPLNTLNSGILNRQTQMTNWIRKKDSHLLTYYVCIAGQSLLQSTSCLAFFFTVQLFLASTPRLYAIECIVLEVLGFSYWSPSALCLHWLWCVQAIADGHSGNCGGGKSEAVNEVSFFSYVIHLIIFAIRSVEVHQTSEST